MDLPSVVFPPDQSERQWQFQICHRQQRYALRTSPAGIFVDESHADPMQNKTENRGFIHFSF